MKLGLGLDLGLGVGGSSPAFIEWLNNGFISPDTLTTGALYVTDNTGALVTAGANKLGIPGARLSGGEFVLTDGVGAQLFTGQNIKTRTQGSVIDYSTDADYKGMMVMPARTNLFLNSDTPVTQNVATTAQKYTVSVIGTGDITLSGTATGTATEASPLTVTASAGTLTCTVNGTLTHGQVEAGAYATPKIVTAGAATPRAATVASFNTAGRIRANNWAGTGIAVPSVNSQVPTMYLLASLLPATNITQISTNATSVSYIKYISGVPTSAVVAYVTTKDTPFQWMAYQHSVHGMGLRVREYSGGSWGAWSAWATNANVEDCPLASTFQIGARDSIGQFAGTFPLTATTFLGGFASVGALQSYLATNTTWTLFGG